MATPTSHAMESRSSSEDTLQDQQRQQRPSGTQTQTQPRPNPGAPPNTSFPGVEGMGADIDPEESHLSTTPTATNITGAPNSAQKQQPVQQQPQQPGRPSNVVNRPLGGGAGVLGGITQSSSQASLGRGRAPSSSSTATRTNSSILAPNTPSSSSQQQPQSLFTPQFQNTPSGHQFADDGAESASSYSTDGGAGTGSASAGGGDEEVDYLREQHKNRQGVAPGSGGGGGGRNLSFTQGQPVQRVTTVPAAALGGTGGQAAAPASSTTSGSRVMRRHSTQPGIPTGTTPSTGGGAKNSSGRSASKTPAAGGRSQSGTGSGAKATAAANAGGGGSGGGRPKSRSGKQRLRRGSTGSSSDEDDRDVLVASSRRGDESVTGGEDEDGFVGGVERERVASDGLPLGGGSAVAASTAAGAGSAAAGGEEELDDEVQRRDRGEELVRRRMRERKREKKEAEKREKKRREDEIRRDRERQAERDRRQAMKNQHQLGHRESMGAFSDDGGAYGGQGYPSPSIGGEPVARRNTIDTISEGMTSPGYAIGVGVGGDDGYGYEWSGGREAWVEGSNATATTTGSSMSGSTVPGFPTGQGQQQGPSGSVSPRAEKMTGGGRIRQGGSPLSPILIPPRQGQGWNFQQGQQRPVSSVGQGQGQGQGRGGEQSWASTPMSPGSSWSPLPPNVYGPAGQRVSMAGSGMRTTSYAGSHVSGMEYFDERDGEEGEEGEDGGGGGAGGKEEGGEGGDGDDGDDGGDGREGRGRDEDDDDEDDDLNDEDVEYTLKDRQDAINIEHPFGLPIWKPALYKKSRSVTRNAEQALHLDPSKSAERHLLPGNILWTLLFGWWLALICFVVSALLWCVPFGGGKYGRVIWELGGYLAWPFGRYVEMAVLDGSVEGTEISEDPFEDEDEEDEYDFDGAAVGSGVGGGKGADYDVEDAGRTWGRNGPGGNGKAVDRTRTLRPADFIGGRPDGDATPVASRSLSGQERGASLDSTYGRDPGLDDTVKRNTAVNAAIGYGTIEHEPKSRVPSGSSTVEGRPDGVGDSKTKGAGGESQSIRVRALGRLMYWVAFYLIIAPSMLLVCIICWGLVFTIPMAKLLWVLVRHLGGEPLVLHFRSAPMESPAVDDEGRPLLRAGQPAPRHTRKSFAAGKAAGRIFSSKSKILLCTYRAVGLQYYKYTVDGVNIMFINLVPLVFFVIIDNFFLGPWVARHGYGGFLKFVTSHETVFVLALLSVIPLSYFIGMAVASISAQSSIGMGAVINATFGSIIEIILYCIALTQAKAELVEGSIVGSLLAGVLLMPGMSMVGGAMRRKEQKFNARSAGVTSTMLIMAIIGILTPTLFYEIYGRFQLTCNGCPRDGDSWQCKQCYYEHVDPVDDPFYQKSVKALSYYCAVILVFSYLIGLWFSLRTHASQIWQNAQPVHTVDAHIPRTDPNAHRASIYKRIPAQVLNQILPQNRPTQGNPTTSEVGDTPAVTPAFPARKDVQTSTGEAGEPPSSYQLPAGLTAEEFNRAFHVVASTVSAFNNSQGQGQPALHREPSRVSIGGPTAIPVGGHNREVSRAGAAAEATHEHGGHGGHDAPNWSRTKSYSVLMGCTFLYAIIAEILVDVVDVVLEGSGIPEKFLGVTLFALVPNTTEFMNAISFAMHGNISLSLEIGSAYALQVCLIQIPAMLAFSAFYAIGKTTLAHHAFTLVFPRWDVIAIMFAVFLLTYTYIEARSNYYRGTILILSYLVLLGGFYYAPAGLDTEDSPITTLATHAFTLGGHISAPRLDTLQSIKALFTSLFTR